MIVFGKVLATLRAGWIWLIGPDLHAPPTGAPSVTRRRTAGEVVLAVVLSLVAAGIEDLVQTDGLLLALTAVGAAALSLLRRRLPTLVLIITAAVGGLAAGFALLLTVVAWSAGRRIVGAGRALVAFTIAYVLFVGSSLLGAWSEKMPLTLALLTTLYFLATAVVPALASRYWSQRRTLLHALQERNAQLLWERQMVAGQARLLERQRIAQDMHDSLGHQLALISVHAGALEVDPELTERQREGVGVLRTASVAAMHELREVVGILQDGVHAPTEPVDESGRAVRGTAGIESLVEAARAAGNTVKLRTKGELRPLAAAADHAAYRIVQEALTNAYKHAPGAPIAVELRYEPDSLVVEIVSAAAPQEPDEVVSGGQGLTGLRERARLVGGMVHAGALDDGGFRVAGVLPYGVVEATPLVAVEDDFHQQAPKAVGVDGVPVQDWSAGGMAPMMSKLDGRVGRGRAGGIGLGCGISLAALLVLVVVAVVGVFFLLSTVTEGMIDPEQYEQVRVGDDEDSVRKQLPSGDTIATLGLDGKGPKPPEGSDCLVLMSSEVGNNIDSEPVFRFCFKDGKLVEKKGYEVGR
ncbi:sensor histidine kinase [Streptomyces sp. NBC_00690]|uniref:sensor histidine kinase n=1 Tax=Streptomyces sp. NBC_00690 TaxID=2975808 RepID=UPI002E2DBF70|nr:histidine kinase [Streptomyces sp. NBC_00690]